MSGKFNSVIFGLDGTLIDSAPGILQSFAVAFEKNGITPRLPWSTALIGPPLHEIISMQCGSQDSTLLELIKAAFIDSYDSEGFRLSTPFSGIQTMLEKLSSKNIKLFIATNKRIKPTQYILSHLNWRSKFQGVFGIDSIASPQTFDKNTVIQHITSQFKLSYKRTLYVGDRYEDYQAATAAGIDFALAAWGFGEAECLIPSSTLRMKSGEELCAIFEGTTCNT
ncbi:MAG: HAD family hydrolase [Candidatus Saccharibacteria bacterium]|nr:HAD family hydrolase [Rhodoferax sp.]